MSPSAAFATSLSLSLTSLTSRSALQATSTAPLRLRARHARRARPVMTADPATDDEKTVSLTDSSMDASAIMKEMRETAGADDGPRTLNTGVTRDADGKSNVWAVEPTLEVQSAPEVNKGVILGAVFAAVAFALLVLPKLPFVNADQF